MSARPIRLLALTPHPMEGPGTRYRVLQYLPYLAQHGFHCEHQPFFDSAEYGILYRPGHWLRKARAVLAGTLRRIRALRRLREFDVVLVYLWLHPIWFPVLDFMLARSGIPVVFDLDDPIYFPQGSIADRLRDREWIIRLLRMARAVIAGSEPIAAFARQFNNAVEVIPTAIDTERFTPRPHPDGSGGRPVVGWVGTHSTSRFLLPLIPVLRALAREEDFTLRLVGARGGGVPLDGIPVEHLDWTLAHEVQHFRDLDIGLYPLTEDVASAGTKLGFKLHQYMAVGVPAVASAVGLTPSLVRDGETALLASNPEEWHASLRRLLRDPSLRRRIGQEGRAEVEASWSLRAHAPRLAEILRHAAASRGIS